MFKNKTPTIDNLSGYSSDFAFTFFKDRTRDKLHLLKAKITQFQEKNYPPNQRRNISMEQIARNNVNALVKHQKYKIWLQQQNPESEVQLTQNEEEEIQVSDQKLFQLSQEQKIYLQHSALKYVHKNDSGRKWRINLNPQIDYSFLKDSEVLDFLSLLCMFQNGYFPFVGKKDSKSKTFVQHMDMLKKRPSKNIETFKASLTKEHWVIFSWIVEKSKNQVYIMCVEILFIGKELNPTKIDYEIDVRLKEDKYKIAPGEVKFIFDKDLKIKPEEVFKFGDKSFHFSSSNTEMTRRVFPSKVERQKTDLKIIPQAEKGQSFEFEIQIIGDYSNYDSVRYFYKELQSKGYFSYPLSPSQYDVLETKGNLIVIGRSGSGKTTCALLRLFFKELNNIQKRQKNVFLTASPVLIAQINKKYDQIKQNIKKINNYDYFEEKSVIFDENIYIKKFYNRLDEINETFLRQKINSFLECKTFPCFLTIREYIDSIDLVMENPFFSSTRNNKNNTIKISQEITIYYPEQIEWQQRIRKTRNVRHNLNQYQNLENQQEWLEIKFENFARKICELPEIKRISGKLSPEIIWSQIYSTIKGSSRAHSFVGKFLDQETYSKESKNKFLTVEDKKKIYEIFIAYEKIKQNTKQYDLLDVVNNIILQLGKRKNHDLALSSLFIDQVQDLPPAFIFLAGKIVQQSLFFCGDTAQTIAKGVSFSFSDVREQFSQKYFEKGFKLEKPKIKQLGVNYRSQNQIIQLSNSLIRCLEVMFPESIDHMPFEMSPTPGPKPVIMSLSESQGLGNVFKQQFGNRLDSNATSMFGADKAIIVRSKDDKRKVPQSLEQMTCLTYQQCKGLEYNVVILYNFFTSAPDVQWSFLKHIELQSKSNGEKGLSFDKNRLGSNIRMYFDLCSELKILYTVVTRPRTILIICDDKVPEQLLRIWKFMDLVQDADTFYKGLNEQQNTNNNNPNKTTNDFKGKVPNEQINVPQDLNQTHNDRNEQKFQTFRKEWADEGFKLFFEHKLYDQAVKCFKHAEIKELNQISKAFFFAQYAYNGADTVEQSQEYYLRGGQIFERYRRNYEAGKCYYLGRQYKKALNIFRVLNIKKYQAQCLWKMKEYSSAEKLFYGELKLQKCFNVLVESEYWFLAFVRLYENPNGFRKIGFGQVRQGLDGIMQSFLRPFTTWILYNWEFIDATWFSESIQPLLTKRYEENTFNLIDKVSYLKKNQNQFESEQKRFQKLFPFKKGELQEVHMNFITQIYNHEYIQGVIDRFFTTLMYMSDQLRSFNLINNFKKYNLQKLKIQPSIYLGALTDKTTFFKALQIIFNILQTFDYHQFISIFAKSLQMTKIQQLISIENFLKIDARKLSQQKTLYRISLHYELINQIDDKMIGDKLSLLLLLFGRLKAVSHVYKHQDVLLGQYSGDYNGSYYEIVRLKPFKVANQHEFICFDQNYLKTHSQRTLHTSYQYQTIFALIDDLTPNSFFLKNQKQKQYVEHFKLLTEEQRKQLKEKQQLAVKQKLQELQKKIKRTQTDLKYAEEDKIKIFAKTFKQQDDALEKKIKIMKLIPKYVWLPEQCEKNPQKTYKMKKNIAQIKKQRNQMLNAIDIKIKTKTDSLNTRVDTLKKIRQLEQKLKQEYKNCQNEKNGYLNKNQQVLFLEQKVRQMQYYISPVTNQIKQLQNQKKGTNKQDKKLNHRIKILNDSIKQQNSILQSRKALYKKSKDEFQKIKQYLQSLFRKNQEIEYEIRESKQFLCQLNLARFEKNDSFILAFSQEHTITLIKQHLQKIKVKIQDSGQSQKNVIKKLYKTTLINAEDYYYYQQTVPSGCRQDRDNIVKNIQSLNTQIQNLNKQKQVERLRTQAKVKTNYESKCFRKHCWIYRQNFITDQILNNQLLKQKLDNEFIDVLKLISRLSPPGTKISQDQINKNSVLLDRILTQSDSSFEKIFIISHFLIHQKQLSLLQLIVVKEIYNKFFQQIEKFLENVKNQSQDSATIKNTLAIFGINVIENLQNDEFKYLDGFSFIEKQHNFGSFLKDMFYHNIASTHILCRTMDIMEIMENFFITKVKSSTEIFRSFDLEQFVLKDSRNFNMRSQQFLKGEEKHFISLIRNAEFNQFRDYLTSQDIRDLKGDLFDLKTVYFTYLIRLEEQQNSNFEINAQKIIILLEKIIELTNFVSSLNNVIEFNKASRIKVGEKYTFIDVEAQQEAKKLKTYIIPKINKVMDKIEGLKQKIDEKPEAQEKQQKKKSQPSNFDQNIYLKGTMSQPAKSKKKKNYQGEQRRINVKMNALNRQKRPVYQTYYQQDQQQIHSIIQSNYQQKAYYDMITGTWVSNN